VKKVERWVKSWARVRCVKGDRRLIDVARAFGHKDIIRLLEDYEQINEFVCATFACDLSRTVEALALGAGFVISSSLTTRYDRKKLTYCKQIARMLHAQYVDGIYSNSVTLKSG